MPVTLIDCIPFKHSLSGAALTDAVKLIEKSRSATNGMVTALVDSIKSGDRSGQTEARNWLMTSPQALLTSAVAANKKLRPSKRRSLEKCLEVPNLLDFSKPIPEEVPVRPKAKKTGGVRMLHDPGLLHRTGQGAVKRIMGAYFVPRRFQYTHRGVQAAIARAKEAIKAGHVYVARLDVKDFYPSFSAEALTDLPLPKQVVEHVVVGRHMKVVVDQGNRWGKQTPLSPHTTNDLLIQARLGLPQGSACSPIIGMFGIARLVWIPTPGVVLLNYADDFLLVSEKPNLLSEAIGGLKQAMGKLPGGHFDLQLKSIGDLDKGFSFVGHHLQIIDAGLRTRPTESNLQAMYGTLTSLEEKIGQLMYVGKSNKAVALKYVASFLAFLDGWMAAFRECDDIGRWIDLPITSLKQWLDSLGISLDEVKAAIEPWMQFEPSDYALGH